MRLSRTAVRLTFGLLLTIGLFVGVVGGASSQLLHGIGFAKT